MAQLPFFQEIHDTLLKRGRVPVNHPFVRGLLDGKVAVPNLKRFVIEMHRRVENAIPLFGIVYANCPDPAGRRMIFDNLMEEERGIFSGTDGHLVLLRRYCDALGITHADWERVSDGLSLEAKAMMWFERVLAYTRPWYVWFAALGIGVESKIPSYFGAIAEASRRHYGVTRDEDLTFWTVHISVDEQHGDVAEQLVSRHLETEVQRAEVRQAIFDLSDLMYEQLTAAAREEQVAPPDERFTGACRES